MHQPNSYRHREAAVSFGVSKGLGAINTATTHARATEYKVKVQRLHNLGLHSISEGRLDRK
jgi:hypothetical protein